VDEVVGKAAAKAVETAAAKGAGTEKNKSPVV
jgi:hypothetical protein